MALFAVRKGIEFVPTGGGGGGGYSEHDLTELLKHFTLTPLLRFSIVSCPYPPPKEKRHAIKVSAAIETPTEEKKVANILLGFDVTSRFLPQESG